MINYIDSTCVVIEHTVFSVHKQSYGIWGRPEPWPTSLKDENEFRQSGERYFWSTILFQMLAAELT